MSGMVNKQKIVMEAGEIIVNRNDTILPTKLRLLGQAGYSIVDAWHDEGGGFRLLLTRPFAEDKEKRGDHKAVIDAETKAGKEGKHCNGPRCPKYCSCMSVAFGNKAEAVDKKEDMYVQL